MPKTDSRRFKRVSIDLPARIVINDTEECEGRLLNMSPGDLAVQADTKAVVGDAAVIRIKGLDIIEGTVARTFPDGLALSFRLSKKRRTLLTEKLMVLANSGLSAGLQTDRRSTPRHRDENTRMVCRLDDGTSLFVKIIDRCVESVAVDAPRRPPVGSVIHVGRSRGIVVRHTPRGFVVSYDTQSSGDSRPALRVV